MIQLPRDFKEFLQSLNSNEARYLVVGGYAVNHYGYARATADLDIWIATHAGNAAKVAGALRSFGFADTPIALLQEPGKVVRLGVPPLRLELLTSISGCEFDDCFGRREIADWEGVAVPLLALDDLRRNKAASGRLRDRLDLENLQ